MLLVPKRRLIFVGFIIVVGIMHKMLIYFSVFVFSISLQVSWRALVFSHRRKEHGSSALFQYRRGFYFLASQSDGSLE